MGHSHWDGDGARAARHLALSLDAAADRLEAARDPQAFIRAVEMNGRLWLSLVGPALGRALPRHRLEFVNDLFCRARQGVNDEEVEAMIRLNRTTSRELWSPADEPGKGR
ncbi:MAG: hypothetical protein ACM31L_20315 [Actinomycetota bacterium]